MSTRHRLRLAIIFSGSFIARATRKPITFPRRCIQLASPAACKHKTEAARDGYYTRDNRNNGGQGTVLSVRFELGLETEIAVTFSALNVPHRLCPFYVPTLLLKHGEKKKKIILTTHAPRVTLRSQLASVTFDRLARCTEFRFADLAKSVR